MEKIKKIALPIKIIIVGCLIGLVFCGIGVVKQINAKRINQERYEQAYKQALENKEKLEKRYAEASEELEELENQYNTKKQECDSYSVSDSDWFSKKTSCNNEANNIYSKMTKLKSELFQIEHYDNTVYYNLVKPMSYIIFYIIGGSIAVLAALGAFIIYLVKGKKTY